MRWRDNSVKSGLTVTQIILDENEGNKLRPTAAADNNFKLDKAWDSLMHNDPGEDNTGLQAEDAGVNITSSKRHWTREPNNLESTENLGKTD